MLGSVVPIGPTSSVPSTFSRKPALSLAGRAYIEIREKILKGDLVVGEVISRRKLAEELNISVPPVTEALQQLESEGLLESKPRVGTRVRVPTRQSVEDRSILREALEAQSARLFAERATPEEREGLMRMGQHLDQLYTCCDTPNVDRGFLFSANMYHMSLHLRVAECARCHALREAIEKEQVLIFHWLYETAVRRENVSSACHARLTELLCKGTPDEAEAAMRGHIRRGMTHLLAKLDTIEAVVGGWRLKRKASAS